MKNQKLTMAAICAAMCVALVSPASADWNSGDPSLFDQMPNLSTTGVDVNCTRPGALPAGYVVADDFFVAGGGKITDIHLWASWKNDLLPDSTWWNRNPDTGEKIGPITRDPGYVKISLGIYEDVPAWTDPMFQYPYSTPGNLVWSVSIDNTDVWHLNDPWFTTRMYADNIQEGFMNPVEPLQYTFPGDTECYQYNCYIPEDIAFTAIPGKIYWLGVVAQQLDSTTGAVMGWKTSVDYWNDRAVGAYYGDAWDGWNMFMRMGQGYDMAFVITPEPATLALLAAGGLAMLRRRKQLA